VAGEKSGLKAADLVPQVRATILRPEVSGTRNNQEGLTTAGLNKLWKNAPPPITTPALGAPPLLNQEGSY
jgi:hypothetical protein